MHTYSILYKFSKLEYKLVSTSYLLPQISAVNTYVTDTILRILFKAPTTAPTPIILVNRTCNAITLKWGAPPSTGGLPVLKYTLEISKNLQHSYTNLTSPSATLRQMEPNTKYTLAVRAVNFIGHSEWTESVMVTTLKRGTYVHMHCTQGTCNRLYYTLTY